MTAIKDPFPYCAPSFELLPPSWELILVSLLAIPLVTWSALRLSMVITVWRANALLLRIKRLKPRLSTYEDALRLAREYGSHANFGDTPCNSNDCSFGIHLANDWLVPESFVETDLLGSLGIRYCDIDAFVKVRKGRVSGVGFSRTEAKKCAPYGQWLEVRTAVSFADHFSEWFDGGFLDGRRLGLEKLPHRYVVNPVLTTGGGGHALDSYVSSDATAWEIERAFDYRLSCVSSLAGCSDLTDLVPTAWEDHLATEAASYSPKSMRSMGLVPYAVWQGWPAT